VKCDTGYWKEGPGKSRLISDHNIAK